MTPFHEKFRDWIRYSGSIKGLVRSAILGEMWTIAAFLWKLVYYLYSVSPCLVTRAVLPWDKRFQHDNGFSHTNMIWTLLWLPHWASLIKLVTYLPAFLYPSVKVMRRCVSRCQWVRGKSTSHRSPVHQSMYKIIWKMTGERLEKGPSHEEQVKCLVQGYNDKGANIIPMRNSHRLHLSRGQHSKVPHTGIPSLINPSKAGVA